MNYGQELMKLHKYEKALEVFEKGLENADGLVEVLLKLT